MGQRGRESAAVARPPPFRQCRRGQLRVHYPELFHGDPNWHPRAEAFATKTYELLSFLTDVLGVTTPGDITFQVDCQFDPAIS